MFKKIVFIINPIFGINRSPSRIIRWIDEYWMDSGVAYEVLKTGHRGHATELARAAVDAGVDMVVACGGDGTINEIGQTLVSTDTVLGVVPAGSGNGFARNMNISLNQRKAVAALRNPRLVKIDAGKINEYFFFNVAGAGLDAIISEAFDEFRLRGPVPYFYVGVREYFRYRPLRAEIHLPDRKIQRSPILLSFANLPQFGVGATIAPNALPADGLLQVCVLNPVRLQRAIVNLPKLFNGRIDQLPELEIFPATRVIIHRPEAAPIHTDGDPHPGDALITVQVFPQSLNLALPNFEQ